METDNAQQGTEQQQPSGTSAGQSNVDLSNYVEKARFTGLQGKLQQVQEENTKLKAQLHDLSGESESQIATLNTTNNLKTSLESQLAAVTQERDTFKTQTLQFQSQLDVAKTILDPKYQGLQPLYAKGLLAVDGKSGDDLKKFLDEAVSTLQTQTSQQVQQRLGGATPETPPGNPGQQTAKQLEEQLLKLPPNSLEYNTVFKAWQVAIAKPPNA